MKYLAIDKEPHFLAFALFEDKALVEHGYMTFNAKNENDRIKEIWSKIEHLIKEKKPLFVLTQMIDLNDIRKKELEKIVTVPTILRKLSIDCNAIYSEFRTFGWEQRITDMDKPSPKRKLKIAREYDSNIELVKIANAIILGESVVHGRLQIGRD